MRSPRTAVVTTLAAVLILAFGTVAYYLARDTTSRPATADTPTAARTPTPDAAQLNKLEAQLTSDKAGNIKHALGVPADVPLEPGFLDAVRDWQSITVDPDSYTALTPTSGDIRAVVRDSTGRHRWTLTLDLVGDEWLIRSTRATP